MSKTLKIPEISKVFTINRGFINNLVIENPARFFQTIECFIKDIDLGDSLLAYSENNIITRLFGRACFVSNLLEIDLTSKKIRNQLYRLIEDSIDSGKRQTFLETLNCNVIGFFKEQLLHFEIPLVSDGELKMVDLIKVMDFTIGLTWETFLEKITNYVGTIQKLFRINTFFFLNLKQFLTPAEYELFAKEMRLNNTEIFLIERQNLYISAEYDRLTIIDNDLCEIE